MYLKYRKMIEHEEKNQLKESRAFDAKLIQLYLLEYDVCHTYIRAYVTRIS